MADREGELRELGRAVSSVLDNYGRLTLEKGRFFPVDGNYRYEAIVPTAVGSSIGVGADPVAAIRAANCYVGDPKREEKHG